MNFIIRHTEFLLSRHDCVIIPELGAVLAHRKPARFDAVRGCVLPPCRAFSFNGMLTLNDGMLACSLSRAKGISYDAAMERISQEAEAMKRLLHNTGQLPLGKIGVLHYNADTDTVQFDSNESCLLSPDTAWLPAITRIGNTASDSSSAIQEENSDEEAYRPAQYSTLARYSKIAACLAGLIGVCFVASTPISIKDAALASLSPEITHVPAEEFLPAEEMPIPSISIKASHSKEAVIDIDALPSGAFASTVSLKSLGISHIVVIGSFASSEEAMKFINSRNDKSLKFIEKDGRFRVYASAHTSEVEAYRDINTHAYSDTGAWVCRL